MTQPSFTAADVTVVIPTIGREQVLLNTIRACLDEPEPPCQVIVVDQSKEHEPETTRQLSTWQQDGRIKVLTPDVALQPAAMNVGTLAAKSRLLLFLDDDVESSPGFVAAHAAAHDNSENWCVVGQIIQPWHEAGDAPRVGPDHGLCRDLDFPFHSTTECHIYNGMSGHMSITRERCLEVGGFDENYKGIAYRFDTEFARRVIKHGGKVLFCPKASLKHLSVARGGTRRTGSRLGSADPGFGVGDYYFALTQGEGLERWTYIGKRMIREPCNKWHLARPWFIPVKLLGEVRALIWACRLFWQGPVLVTSRDASEHGGTKP